MSGHPQGSLMGWILVAFLAVVPTAGMAGQCDKVLAADELLDCLGQELTMVESELNRIHRNLNRVQGPERADDLKKSELLWREQRDRQCESEAREAQGGQAYQALYISCLTFATQLRTTELRRLLRSTQRQ